MNFKQADYLMVIVSDMDRSIAFYRDTLGLPLKMQSPGWSEFQTGPTILALHGGGATREHTEFSSKQFAGTCSFGFSVENIQAAFDELKGKGVHFVMPPTRSEEDRIILAVCLDPDGLPISFAEPIRD